MCTYFKGEVDNNWDRNILIGIQVKLQRLGISRDKEITKISVKTKNTSQSKCNGMHNNLIMISTNLVKKPSNSGGEGGREEEPSFLQSMS